MIRERTFMNLAIGVALSLLLHASLVIWGPPLGFQITLPRTPSDVEVQLREWPVLPPMSTPQEPTKIVEDPPVDPVVTTPPRPAVPPDTLALQEAVQAVGIHLRQDSVDMQLPELPAAVQELALPPDPLQIAQTLRDAFPPKLQPLDPTIRLPLPEPERIVPERQDPPPLPALERFHRPEGALTRPVTVPMVVSNPALQIQGPAAERQVIFQPPPPTATVDREIEIELRFWILPNGTVSRVVPLKKADPRLETLAINYLRHWRFNPLPTDLTADEQWGIIPFKFRIR
jgi:Gram-negative bacterial TonB protein C-terminal